MMVSSMVLEELLVLVLSMTNSLKANSRITNLMAGEENSDSKKMVRPQPTLDGGKTVNIMVMDKSFSKTIQCLNIKWILVAGMKTFKKNHMKSLLKT